MSNPSEDAVLALRTLLGQPQFERELFPFEVRQLPELKKLGWVTEDEWMNVYVTQAGREYHAKNVATVLHKRFVKQARVRKTSGKGIETTSTKANQ
jgi:hypothetical protein